MFKYLDFFKLYGGFFTLLLASDFSMPQYKIYSNNILDNRLIWPSTTSYIGLLWLRD